MRKSLILVRSNIRRAKGQMAVIFGLIIFAAILLNIWLILATDYKQNFERSHDRLNGEHVTAVFDSDRQDFRRFLKKTVKDDARSIEFCLDDVLWMQASIDYSGGTLASDFLALEKESALARTVGKYEIVQDGADESGIYLPVLFAQSNNYAAGDTIEIQIGNRTLSYTVCGFYNSVMTGSHNCGMCAFLLTDDVFDELREESLAAKSTMLSVRISDRGEAENFEAEIKNAVGARFPAVCAISNSYGIVSNSRYISQMICSAIISAMAFFVTVIVLVVIASNTANDIQENMRELGVLKAVGYTGNQLIGALLFQFLGFTLTAASVGIALSYGIFPSVNRMMVSQTGIPYQVRFLFVPLLITFAATAGTVALAVWFSARKIKRLETISALRQGIETHSFKHNRIPLETTGLPVNAALAFKTALSGKKRNIIICITMFVISLIVVFSGVMAKNVIFDMQPMIELIVGETADSFISVSTEDEADFLEEMRKDERVDKSYLFHQTEVRHVGHLALNAIVIDDGRNLNNQNLCIEGRFPKYENEMLIGARYAAEQKLEVGDKITMTAEGKEADFIICGFTQTSNYLGKDCLMLRSGYERMGKMLIVTYYSAVRDDVDVDAFHEDIVERLKDRVLRTVNVREVIDGTASVYVSVITVIVIAILCLSLAVIVFVLYLLVRTLLTGKRRDYKILKSLGYTTGQLILQTAASFMPAIILSAFIGMIVSAAVMNPIIALFLKGIGMVRCTFDVPLEFIGVSYILLVLAAFLFACLMSLRIRKKDFLHPF